MHYYGLYGSTLASEWQMDLPAARACPRAISVRQGLDIPLEFREGVDADASWFVGRRSAGNFFMRWRGIADFTVRSDGLEINVDIAGQTPWSVVQAYLLNQVLSMALLGQGRDSLHGVACECKGRAFLFVGNSGFGKSTLLTHLLSRGARFLSDDLLVLQSIGGALNVHRGLPRIKAYEDTVGSSQLKFKNRTCLSPFTEKYIYEILDNMISPFPSVPVERIYVIEEVPAPEIQMCQIHGAEKFAALASNVFNSLEVEDVRRTTSLKSVSEWCSLPVVKLAYPREWGALDRLVSELVREFEC